MEALQVADEKIEKIKNFLYDEIYKSRIMGKHNAAIQAILSELFVLVDGSYTSNLRISNNLLNELEAYHDLSIEHMLSLFRVNLVALKSVRIENHQEPL